MRNEKIWSTFYKRNLPKNPQDRFVNEFSKYLPSGSLILDFGCGEGHATANISSKGFDVIGIDIAGTAIRKAKKNYPALIFKKMDCLRTSFKAQTFDGLYCLAVYHTLLKNERIRFVNELYRLLKPNGVLFMLVIAKGDTTLNLDKEIENNTYIQPKSQKTFHLFMEKELIKDFSSFHILKIKKLTRRLDKKTNSVFVLIAKKFDGG